MFDRDLVARTDGCAGDPRSDGSAFLFLGVGVASPDAEVKGDEVIMGV